jgi:hypothetical protein
MGKYLDMARKFEARMQAERKGSSPLSSQSSPVWPCPHCGTLTVIDEVCPSLDSTRQLTLWHCEPCQTWGVTPDNLQQPPVWVSSKEQ